MGDLEVGTLSPARLTCGVPSFASVPIRADGSGLTLLTWCARSSAGVFEAPPEGMNSKSFAELAPRAPLLRCTAQTLLQSRGALPQQAALSSFHAGLAREIWAGWMACRGVQVGVLSLVCEGSHSAPRLVWRILRLYCLVCVFTALYLWCGCGRGPRLYCRRGSFSLPYCAPPMTM